MGIFITWIGHYCDVLRTFSHLEQQVDDRIWPLEFQLDTAGTPIAGTQHALKLAKNLRTRVAFFQDRPTENSEVWDTKYVDPSSDFNYCISDLGNRNEPSQDLCWQRFFYFPDSDIPDDICQTFEKRIRNGELVIETPQDFSTLTQICQPSGITPQKMTLDIRDEDIKREHLYGVPRTTFKKTIELYKSQQHIRSWVKMG